MSKTPCSYRYVVCSIFVGNSTKYVEFQPHDMLELKRNQHSLADCMFSVYQQRAVHGMDMKLGL